MITDQTYLAWQKKLQENYLFRWFWGFWGIYSVLIFLVIGIYLLAVGERGKLLLVLFAFVLARLILSPLIYFIFKRQRPYQKLQFVPIHNNWLLSGITVRLNSLPSDHAASFASIGLTLFWFFPSLGILVLALAILNGCARVILGYHYPSHILFGWLVGLISAWAVIAFFSPVLIKY